MARAVWLAVVAVIVAAGIAVAALSPNGSPSRAADRLPATVADSVGFHCLRQSGAYDFGNLRALFVREGGFLGGAVVLTRIDATGFYPSDGTLGPGLRIATSQDRQDVVDRLDACLGRFRFASSLLPDGADERLRVYQYQAAVYRPCLAAHHVNPGKTAPLTTYLMARTLDELGDAQPEPGLTFDGFLEAMRACPPLPS
jgi:hypothetical protein